MGKTVFVFTFTHTPPGPVHPVPCLASPDFLAPGFLLGGHWETGGEEASRACGLG